MELHEILGSIGVFLLLLAYVLNATKLVGVTSWVYLSLNISGAVLAAWSSFLLNFWPFIILESTWAGISIVALINKTIRFASGVK